jgi:hypothetical protein
MADSQEFINKLIQEGKIASAQRLDGGLWKIPGLSNAIRNILLDKEGNIDGYIVSDINFELCPLKVCNDRTRDMPYTEDYRC